VVREAGTGRIKWARGIWEQRKIRKEKKGMGATNTMGEGKEKKGGCCRERERRKRAEEGDNLDERRKERRQRAGWGAWK
jgi:hypothetical protein